ncbi:MAG: glutathione S-transferase [Thiothrix nivea]|nr:MAG: glutathione S-transferase [Thiothrix nivea]
MQDKIIFYTHPWSRGRVTRWMLEECQANYQTEVLEYDSSMKADTYLAINPMGKVPALKHGDTVFTENAAICMYLADVFTDKQLAPPVGSKARGTYYRWLLFVAGPLEAVATAKSLKQLPEQLSEKERGQAGYGCLEDVVKTLEQSLAGITYLCGDRFSTADLYMTAYLNWYMQFDLIPKRPVFEQYVQQHINRPAALKASEIDEALSKKYPVDF